MLNQFKKGALATGIALSLLTGNALASVIAEVEPNDSVAGAQNINGSFSLDADANIFNSTTIPHVTINGTGNNTGDYFSFTAGAGDRGIFDIDFSSGFDSWLNLYTGAGAFITSNDDASTTLGAGGSTSGLDSYLEYNFTTSGTYVIQVGTFFDTSNVSSGVTYDLQVSIEEVPEPSILALMGLGLVGLGFARSRAKK